MFGEVLMSDVRKVRVAVVWGRSMMRCIKGGLERNLVRVMDVGCLEKYLRVVRKLWDVWRGIR